MWKPEPRPVLLRASVGVMNVDELAEQILEYDHRASRAPWHTADLGDMISDIDAELVAFYREAAPELAKHWLAMLE